MLSAVTCTSRRTCGRGELRRGGAVPSGGRLPQRKEHAIRVLPCRGYYFIKAKGTPIRPMTLNGLKGLSGRTFEVTAARLCAAVGGYVYLPDLNIDESAMAAVLP